MEILTLKFKLKHSKWELLGSIITFVILVIFLIFNHEYKWGFFAALSVLISLDLAYFVFVLNKYSKISNKVNGVNPVWRILTVDSKIEYFSLDKSHSVLDNVRYYSLIVDSKHKIQSINKLNTKCEVKKEYQDALNEKNEIIDFYFSSNAIVESEKQYNIGDLLLTNSTNEMPVFMPLTQKQKDNHYSIVNVIKATTIFSDNTFFFEGDGLSGGLILINGKYKPYSGIWGLTSKGTCKIDLAKEYLTKIQEKRLTNNKIITTSITTRPPEDN